jgi:hypothetical protein
MSDVSKEVAGADGSVDRLLMVGVLGTALGGPHMGAAPYASAGTADTDRVGSAIAMENIPTSKANRSGWHIDRRNKASAQRIQTATFITPA